MKDTVVNIEIYEDGTVIIWLESSSDWEPNEKFTIWRYEYKTGQQYKSQHLGNFLSPDWPLVPAEVEPQVTYDIKKESECTFGRNTYVTYSITRYINSLRISESLTGLFYGDKPTPAVLITHPESLSSEEQFRHESAAIYAFAVANSFEIDEGVTGVSESKIGESCE